MIEQEPPDDQSQFSQFDAEAATWFARMRGPDADQHRAAFERWLSLGALHKMTYDRIARIWDESEILKLGRATASADAYNRAPGSSAGERRRVVPLASIGATLLAAGLACILLWPGGTFHLGHPPRSGHAAPQAQQLATALGEIRRSTLGDGSIVTLDTDSLLTVNFTAKRRFLRLEHGRARFDVAHDSRPFAVAAGRGIVVARGTMFDVGISPDQIVHVTLLRGAVEVRLPSRHMNGPSGAALVAGEAVAFARSGTEPLVHEPFPPATWPSGNVEFDNTPLAEVVAEANRYSVRKIRFADPKLGDLLVSGTFGVRDTAKLANSLAALFALRVIADPTELVLSQK